MESPRIWITILESGKKVIRFSLATNKNYKNFKGEKVQTTDWHNMVTRGKQKVPNLIFLATCEW